jgi:hypothetical protein
VPKVKMPRSPSDRTDKLFRMPNTTTRRLAWEYLHAALSVAGYGNSRPSWDDARIYLPDEVYVALLRHLESVDLPLDRRLTWICYGEPPGEQSFSASTLRRVGVEWDRSMEIAEALLAIEPFPSKKPLPHGRVRRALGEVGDVWSECYRELHDQERRAMPKCQHPLEANARSTPRKLLRLGKKWSCE